MNARSCLLAWTALVLAACVRTPQSEVSSVGQAPADGPRLRYLRTEIDAGDESDLSDDRGVDYFELSNPTQRTFLVRSRSENWKAGNRQVLRDGVWRTHMNFVCGSCLGDSPLLPWQSMELADRSNDERSRYVVYLRDATSGEVVQVLSEAYLPPERRLADGRSTRELAPEAEIEFLMPLKGGEPGWVPERR